VCAFKRQLPGGEFQVHCLKADEDDEKENNTEGCDRRWKQQVERWTEMKVFQDTYYPNLRQSSEDANKVKNIVQR
jgi:cyclopropane fatty-acyl-phospholipid synthase-like methyltransferase